MARPFKVFISYRRDDAAGHSGRLYDRLAEHFGAKNIFMDVDNIPPGTDFAKAIRDAVSSCDVLLAVVGGRWLASMDEDGKRRLDNENDFVRLEILAALERKVTLIPVLVQGAAPLRARDLPDALTSLALLQVHELSDIRWMYDVGRLIKALDLEERRLRENRHKSQPFLGPYRKPLLWAVLVLCISGLFARIVYRERSSARPAPSDVTPAPKPVLNEPTSFQRPSDATPSRKKGGLSESRARILKAGMSVRLDKPDAPLGTICCFVQDSSSQVYLLTSQVTFPWGQGDWVVTPSADKGSEKIAVLSRSISLGSGKDINAGLALVLPGFEPSQAAEGVGPIQGSSEVITPGETVSVVGGRSGPTPSPA